MYEVIGEVNEKALNDIRIGLQYRNNYLFIY